ncbi:phosphate/phosphite/phosphonate ABC transporter substrate-binding protein [Lysobacter auxotrophicus]|uniref:Phosphate/phosphite/phosphonate ABC transporter substrate-binding protein n=1 Tax=Lysobacter auxotrophicus TaxID=2992573 RepID=A0ABM8DFQ6_9GAMM|nr:phosphate/phosphite/phosphonate ABC transporter substrate-binding protein [Lysobacter auxotrophicus]BDU17434.1 phosphate/phosphite/phosphonate ABC transporter substrate-binding protein [Lysobacter auxotrophicus]
MIASLRRTALLTLCSLALAAAPLLAVAGNDSGVLVLGRISDNPKKHYEQLKPLLDYVIPRLADVGIHEGRILMAKDTQQMASYLRRGRVDWVTETTGTAMLLRERARATTLLLTERDGVSHYHSIFFARRDSGLTSLDDLRGHSIAFQRPNSTSAYFVPAAELLRRGFSLEILLSPEDRIERDEVGYLFAWSELNISTWVHKGLADVGVMSNLDWTNPHRMPPSFRNDLTVIGETNDYPRAVEMVRAGLDPRVEARLREVLIDAAGDPEAGDALLRFFNTTRFMPVDPESQEALDRISEGVARVRAEVE